ncbi:MAG: helix-turn-helix transcriptional regulator [Sphingorhabdus sp.]|nr:helix-turn-helix transcriptional regulator [Sphingorhabdus sp.]
MTALFQSRVLTDAAVEKLKVYAQPQRLMILSCLLYGEKTVGELQATTGIGQPALSQQLAELRRSDMVTTRRAAKLVYYDLASEKITLCVSSMEAILCDHDDPAAALRSALNASTAASNPVPPALGNAAPIRQGTANFVRIG